jgi:hypothetical protein
VETYGGNSRGREKGIVRKRGGGGADRDRDREERDKEKSDDFFVLEIAYRAYYRSIVEH